MSRLSFIKSLLALLVIMFSVSVAPVFAQGDGNPLDAVAGQTYETDFGGDSITAFVGPFVQAIIGVLGVAAVILFIYAGFLWMTASGNDEQVKKAKSIMKQVIIGIIIVFVAFGIVSFVIQQVGEVGSPQTQTPSQGDE